MKQSYREKVRFLRGYVQNIGFNRTNIEYEARARAGESKYSLKKLFKFSINTILCFSNLPLNFGIYCGIFVGMMGVLLMIYTIYGRMVHGAPSGYATIVVVMCFMFAMLFVVLGMTRRVYCHYLHRTEGQADLSVKETANIEEKSEK